FARALDGLRKHLANRAPARRRLRIGAGARPGIFLPLDRAGPGRRRSPALHLGPLAHQARAFQSGLAGGQALTSASAILGLLGCGLLGLAGFATVIRLRRLPVRVRYAVMLAAALAVFVPIGDLSIAAWVRGVTGDLSAATLVLAGAACFTQLTGRTLIGHRDKRALCWLLALAAAFLYPFALGWTPFDRYALGFGSVEFVTALLLVTLAAWGARLNLIVLVVVVAV